MKPGKDHPAWLHKAMADGGSAWTGEGDSGKKLREESLDYKRKADSNFGSFIPMGVGAGLMAGAGAKGKLIGAGLAAAGVPSAVKMFKADAKEDALKKAADKQEGRKRGGKVKGKR